MFAGNVAPPGSEEFHVCAQQIIRLAAHTDCAQQQLESKDNQRLHSTTELHRAKTEQLPGLWKAKHTHTDVYFDVF